MVGTKQTTAERMKLIRDAAHKFQGNKTRESRFTRVERSSEMAAVLKKETGTSEIHWTDSSKYANQYYGEVYRATTQYDNEWN